MLYSELSRDQRQGSESSLAKLIFLRWFPVAFLTNSVFIEFDSILDFERRGSQRQGSEISQGSRLCGVVSHCLPRQWCLNVTHEGIELTSSVLCVRMLNHYATVPMEAWHEMALMPSLLLLVTYLVLYQQLLHEIIRRKRKILIEKASITSKALWQVLRAPPKAKLFRIVRRAGGLIGKVNVL